MRLAMVVVLLTLSGCFSSPDPEVEEPSPAVFPGLAIETDLGVMTVLLYPEAAPETVALMRAYAAEGYYAGRAFYRAVPGHVIQVTDPAGGATDDARRVPLEVSPAHHFSAGALGIARGEDPGSGGPEFFVMDFATSHLDGNYTVWGQVVRGMDVVRRAARVPAVEGVRGPDGAFVTPFDRIALQPAQIVSVREVEVGLSAAEAAGYPLRVAQNVRVGDFRHSLEWPADLRPGREADLTWYVRPYNGTAAPSPAEVRVRVGGELVEVVGNTEAEGVYHFPWTPKAAGAQAATLLVSGAEAGTLTVVARDVEG